MFEVSRFMAGLPDAEVVFNYTEPLENYPPNTQVLMRNVATRAAEAGEEWPDVLQSGGNIKGAFGIGFHDQKDLGLADIQALYAFENDRAQSRDA
ncbi:hypothetical protein O8B93_11905 [Agrobacterium rhizogenes]|nr:hypothetical protein [Rhizobium rhizogenes]